MNYQITREGSEYGGYSVRLEGEFFPYERLGRTYLGHLRDTSDLLGEGMWHYVPVIWNTQLPGIYVHNDNLEEFLQHIARMTDEQSRRAHNAAQEALEWISQIINKDRDAYWIDERQLAAIAKAEADKGQETTEFSSLNDD